MTVVPLPTRVTHDPDALFDDIVQRALAQGLHFVIDRRGEFLVTPIVMPGMQVIAVRIAAQQRAAA